jgi:hypothetical protein
VSAMRISFLIFLSVAVHGNEMLLNGNFRRGVQHWRFNCVQSYENCYPKVTRVDGMSTVNVNVPKIDRSNTVLLAQDIKVETGKHYRLGLELRMEAEGQVRVMVKQRAQPWKANGLFRALRPNDKWQRFELNFKGTDVNRDNPPVFRIDLGELKGLVQIRNCSIVAVDESLDVGKWGGKVIVPKDHGQH